MSKRMQGFLLIVVALAGLVAIVLFPDLRGYVGAGSSSWDGDSVFYLVMIGIFGVLLWRAGINSFRIVRGIRMNQALREHWLREPDAFRFTDITTSAAPLTLPDAVRFDAFLRDYGFEPLGVIQNTIVIRHVYADTTRTSYALVNWSPLNNFVTLYIATIFPGDFLLETSHHGGLQRQTATTSLANVDHSPEAAHAYHQERLMQVMEQRGQPRGIETVAQYIDWSWAYTQREARSEVATMLRGSWKLLAQNLLWIILGVPAIALLLLDVIPTLALSTVLFLVLLGALGITMAFPVREIGTVEMPKTRKVSIPVK